MQNLRSWFNSANVLRKKSVTKVCEIFFVGHWHSLLFFFFFYKKSVLRNEDLSCYYNIPQNLHKNNLVKMVFLNSYWTVKLPVLEINHPWNCNIYNMYIENSWNFRSSHSYIVSINHYNHWLESTTTFSLDECNIIQKYP